MIEANAAFAKSSTSNNRDAPSITLAVDSGVARITLSRPDKGNSIGVDFVNTLERITLECSERDDIRAVVIASTGSYFSVGGDIDDMVSHRGGLSLPGYIRKCNASLQGSLARLQHMAAPSLGIVQGTAAGGGVSLVASCDIIIASENARFVAAYASVGYCCDMGGSTMLTRRLGVARARRFYLLHEQLNAAAAAEVGLVDIVVAPEKLSEAADAIIRRWANGPTAAYAEIRRLMISAQATPYETQMELETQSLARLVQTEDAKEALAAFVQKRPARFSGT